MIGKWLRRKLELKAAKAALEDIDRFTLGLKGASDNEVGFVVAQATIVRLMYRRDNLLPDSALGVGAFSPEDERLQVQQFLANIIDELQSEAGGDSTAPSALFALGTMVWLHSMRAITFPEIRIFGREMWQQLERGFPRAGEASESFESPTGEPLPADIEEHFGFIPPGLEPVR